jgi:uncharacterized protein (TIGR03435 family)
MAALLAAVHAQPRAQSAAADAVDPNLRFEVASVKRNDGSQPMVRIGLQPGGRFTTVNVPLRMLITFAYRLQNYQLVGGPDWIDSERFDITAKAEHDVPPAPMGQTGPMQIMVRNLLADRFKLVAHEEEREMPIYALVHARDDKRPGPSLKPSTVDCLALMKAGRGGPPPAAGGAAAPICGVRTGRGRIQAGSFPIGQLPSILAPLVQRFVVDRTGLTGNFEFELTYTPDQAGAGAASAAGTPFGADTPAPDPGGASIFTALQEQLGLKLESERGPVKVLVIDSVERPTED